jgi:hypothetical protein
LYFAVSGPPRDANAIVWTLDPWALNRIVAKRGDLILDAEDSKAQGHLREEFSARELPKSPIALESPLKSARITAQRGAFTLHGKTTKPLEAYPLLYKYLARIPIARSKILDLREQLRIAGVAETSVFPELSALCRELLEYWRSPS